MMGEFNGGKGRQGDKEMGRWGRGRERLGGAGSRMVTRCARSFR